MAKPKKRRARASARKPEAQASLADLPKLSAIIIEFAKPLLAHLPTDPPRIDDLRKVMTVATIAWSLPILQRRDDEEAAQLRSLFEQQMALVGPDLRRIIHQMMQLRITRYGHGPRIGTFDVVADGAGRAKIVATNALPEQSR